MGSKINKEKMPVKAGLLLPISERELYMPRLSALNQLKSMGLSIGLNKDGSQIRNIQVRRGLRDPNDIRTIWMETFDRRTHKVRKPPIPKWVYEEISKSEALLVSVLSRDVIPTKVLEDAVTKFQEYIVFFIGWHDVPVDDVIAYDLMLSNMIEQISWYIKTSRKRLKAHGKTIGEVVHKAKIGDIPVAWTAFCALCEIDPIWLTEGWAASTIKRRADKQDRSFFSMLGRAISNERKKVFIPEGTGETKHIVDLMKIYRCNAKRLPLGRDLSEIKKHLELRGISNELTIEGFKKLLRRHLLIPSVSKPILKR